MKQFFRLGMRLEHANTLLSNVGIEVTARVTTGQVLYVIQLWDDGTWCGEYNVYKHERSMMRAAWRLYRQQLEKL